MGNFSTKIKGRAWVATIQIANMEKAGLTKEQYEDPEFVADFFTNVWNESGKERSSGVAVCVSEKGLYHLHMALYGNTTTLGNVSKILFSSHVEPQLGGKKELEQYLKKEGKYQEKGEQVLYCKDIENVQDVQGKRTDIQDIEEYLNQGLTPAEIMKIKFAYRKYEKMIKSAYLDKRIDETPLIKETHNEWHVGESRSGKSYYYCELCDKHGKESVYFCTDFENGGFDLYIEQGAPPILFLDEFKGNMRFATLLSILDKYSLAQTHARYVNTYNLWTTCIITSVFPPELAYKFMVDSDTQSIDSIKQLLLRLDVIVYHYIEDNEYKTFSLPASEYTNYEDLRNKALNNDGFRPMTEAEQLELPFKED